MPLARPTRGLATKSTAPSSSARSVTSAPFSVSVEIITTGMGRKRISRPRKSMPSMRGISTSRVITSGFNSRIISRAIRGSLAVPTHSMSRWRLMISESRLRTSAESSTTTTRIFFDIPIFSSIPSKSEQVHRTTSRGLHDGRHTATLFLCHGFRMGMGQALDHGLASHREETDLARIDVQYILRHHRNALSLQIVAHELGVALSDIHGREVGHHGATTEDLGLYGLPTSTLLHQLVDQQFHRIRTITTGRIPTFAFRQHEVVHSPHQGTAVPDAGGNARPQHRHDHQVLIRHKILTRQDLHGVVLEMVIEIEEARFPGLARLLLELLQRRRPCPHGTRRVVGVGRHRLNAWRLPPVNAGRQRHASRR